VSILIMALMMVTGDVEQWRISNVEMRLEGNAHARFAPPVSMVRGAEGLVVMDSAYQLWFLSERGSVRTIAGGRGHGAGKLDPVFRNLFTRDDAVILLHDSGRRMETYTATGSHQSSGVNKAPLTYLDADGSTLLLHGSHEHDAASVSLVWRRASGAESVPLMTADDEDRCPWLYCLAVRCGDYLLVTTTMSVKRTIHYVLLNWSAGQIWDVGKLALADPRKAPPAMREAIQARPDVSIPVVAGLTSGPETGIVLTESTLPGGFRMLRILDPERQSWRTMRLDLGGLPDLTHAQPLGGNRWAGFAPGALIFFEMEPVP